MKRWIIIPILACLVTILCICINKYLFDTITETVDTGIIYVLWLIYITLTYPKKDYDVF